MMTRKHPTVAATGAAALAGEVLPSAILDGKEIQYLSGGLRALLRIAAGDRSPRFFEELIATEDRERVIASLVGARDGVRESCELLCADGRHVSVALQCVPVGVGAARRQIVAVTDLSALARDATRLRRIAFRDTVTGLANRALVEDRLEQSLTVAKRTARPVYVVLLDLDRFKPINDALGHAAGDAVLREVARRLSSVARASDTVGRLGGDEFVIVLHDAHGREDAAALSTRILKAFREPFANGRWRIGVSIGIAASVREGLGPEQLFARADEAMYAAKIAGGDQFAFWGESRDDARPQTIAWSEALRVGIPAIDAEHEQLAAQMNRLWSAARAAQPRAILDSGLREMLAKLKEHFATEEAYMHAHPYPGATEHLSEHSRVLSVVRGLLAHVDEQSVAIGVRYLADWLNRHVATFDADMVNTAPHDAQSQPTGDP